VRWIWAWCRAAYAGGEIAEANIGLMPGLVQFGEQGGSWKKAAVGGRGWVR